MAARVFDLVGQAVERFVGDVLGRTDRRCGAFGCMVGKARGLLVPVVLPVVVVMLMMGSSFSA